MLYMHNQGVCHLDLRELNNILYDKSTGDVHFIDFGYSGEISDENRMVDAQAFLDTYLKYAHYKFRKVSLSTLDRVSRCRHKVYDDRSTNIVNYVIKQLESLKAELPPKARVAFAQEVTVLAPVTVPVIRKLTTFQSEQQAQLKQFLLLPKQTPAPAADAYNLEQDWTANSSV